MTHGGSDTGCWRFSLTAAWSNAREPDSHLSFDWRADRDGGVAVASELAEKMGWGESDRLTIAVEWVRDDA